MDEECPPAAPSCVDGLCRTVAPAIDGGGSTRGFCATNCDPTSVCLPDVLLCLHPCAVAPSDCPAGTRCDLAGGCQPLERCLGGSGCPFPQRCVDEVCRDACSAGSDECEPGLQCVDETCVPLLDGAVWLGPSLTTSAEAPCVAGPNPDFADRTLEGWCALSSGHALEPRVTTAETLPLRVVLMGRAPFDPLGVSAFSLLQIYPAATDADLDRAVEWDFSAFGDREGWGVALSLHFFGGGSFATYTRTWNEAGMPTPVEALTLSPDLTEAPLRSFFEAPPALVLREARETLMPPLPVESVAIVMTVWTRGARVELQHRALRVSPSPRP